MYRLPLCGFAFVLLFRLFFLIQQSVLRTFRGRGQSHFACLNHLGGCHQKDYPSAPCSLTHSHFCHLPKRVLSPHSWWTCLQLLIPFLMVHAAQTRAFLNPDILLISFHFWCFLTTWLVHLSWTSREMPDIIRSTDALCLPEAPLWRLWEAGGLPMFTCTWLHSPSS